MQLYSQPDIKNKYTECFIEKKIKLFSLKKLFFIFCNTLYKNCCTPRFVIVSFHLKVHLRRSLHFRSSLSQRILLQRYRTMHTCYKSNLPSSSSKKKVWLPSPSSVCSVFCGLSSTSGSRLESNHAIRHRIK